MSWRISRWRPKIGSILPARADAVNEVVKRLSASSSEPAGALAAAGPPAAAVGVSAVSGEAATISSRFFFSSPGGMLSNSGKLSPL